MSERKRPEKVRSRRDQNCLAFFQPSKNASTERRSSMPKRGENIYKRKDGRWEGRIRKKMLSDGHSGYQSVYGRTYREVKEKINAVRQEQTESPCSITFGEASGLWLEAHRADWKPGTYATYRQMITGYVLPYLGGMRLSEMNSQRMEEFAAHVRKEKGEAKLSANYLSQICEMIRRIINYMNKRQGETAALPANPIVKPHARQMIIPSESSLRILEQYLSAHCGKDTCLGILLAFHTGIRIGELSALKWEDIDKTEHVILIRRSLLRIKEDGKDSAFCGRITQVVEQTPKTTDSVRVIPVPPRMIPLIEEHRKEDHMYVISGEKNPWAEPRTIQYRFKNILDQCGIEYFNFHLLRHAFATRCVSKGLDIKSLSEILGHSNIQMTLNLYVHPTIQQKRKMMEQYDTNV